MENTEENKSETKELKDRIKTEGELLRNRGANSIKRLREGIDLNFEKFGDLFKAITESIQNQTELTRAQLNFDIEETEGRKRNDALETVRKREPKASIVNSEGERKDAKVERTNTNFGVLGMAGIIAGLIPRVFSFALTGLSGVALWKREEIASAAGSFIGGFIDRLTENMPKDFKVLGMDINIEDSFGNIAEKASEILGNSVSYALIGMFLGKKAAIAGMVAGVVEGVIPETIKVSDISLGGISLETAVITASGLVFYRQIPKLIGKVLSRTFGLVAGSLGITTIANTLVDGEKGKPGLLAKTKNFVKGVAKMAISGIGVIFGRGTLDSMNAIDAEEKEADKDFKKVNGKIGKAFSIFRNAAKFLGGRFLGPAMLIWDLIDLDTKRQKKVNSLMENDGLTRAEAVNRVFTEHRNEVSENFENGRVGSKVSEFYYGMANPVRGVFGLDPIKDAETTRKESEGETVSPNKPAPKETPKAPEKPATLSVNPTVIPSMPSPRSEPVPAIDTPRIIQPENDPEPGYERPAGAGGRRDRRQSSVSRRYDDMMEADKKKGSKPVVVALQGGDTTTRGGDTHSIQTTTINNMIDPSSSLDPYHFRSFG